MKSANIDEIKEAIKHIKKLEANPDYIKAYPKIYHYLDCGIAPFNDASGTLDEHAIVTAKGARQVFKDHYFIDKKVKPGDSHWDDDIDFNTNAYVNPKDYRRMEKESHHLDSNKLYLMLFSRDLGDYNPPTYFMEADGDMCKRAVNDAIGILESDINSRITYKKKVAKYHHAIKFVKNCRATLKNTPQSVQSTAHKLANCNSTSIPSNELSECSIYFKHGKAFQLLPNTIIKDDKAIRIPQRSKLLSYGLLKDVFINIDNDFKDHKPVLL